MKLLQRPNGPRISCGDCSACALSYVFFKNWRAAGRMRLLGRLTIRQHGLASIPDLDQPAPLPAAASPRSGAVQRSVFADPLRESTFARTCSGARSP